MCTADGIVNGKKHVKHHKKVMAGPQKNKNRTTMGPSNLHLDIYSKELKLKKKRIEIRFLKKYLHTHASALFIIAKNGSNPNIN